MASGKETPRQKMISLMYLVLMAILALNVDKNVLDAFVAVDDGLAASITNTEHQNDIMYQEILSAYELDESKVQNCFQKSSKIREKTSEIISNIEELKKELIVKTDGIDPSVADTIGLMFLNKKENFDIPTEIMIGSSEDGSGGKSAELRKSIEDYKAFVESHFDEQDLNSINLGLNLEGGISAEKQLNWEMYNFYHTPLVASIAILSKLQNDIRAAEYTALSRLYSGIGKQDFPFDTIVAKTVASTNYVLQGEKYSADIFLAAFSTTNDPKITVDGNNVDVSNGIGTYEVNTSQTGLKTYTGEIEVLDKMGTPHKYNFEQSYIVAQPSFTVSPTKMNVLYAGIDNPLSISVPGFSSDQIVASINHGKIVGKGNGQFSVKPPVSNLPSTGKINVAVRVGDETKPMGSFPIRFKRVPNPKARIAGKSSDFVFRKMVLAAGPPLKAIYGEDFMFDGNASMKKATMQFGIFDAPMPKGKWSKDAKELLKKVPKGQSFIIRDIEIIGMDGKKRRLDPIVIKVI